MTIEIDFNYGQEVWLIHQNVVVSSMIKDIKVMVEKSEESDEPVQTVMYRLLLPYTKSNTMKEYWLSPDVLFSSKEELIESL